MEQILELSRAQAGGGRGRCRKREFYPRCQLTGDIASGANKQDPGWPESERGGIYSRICQEDCQTSYSRMFQTGVQAVLVSVLEALPGISCNMQIVNLVLDISGAG